ncbi:MAG: hypothetical protein ACJ790_17990 [Myxococcaceae bacterium]
MDAPAPLRFKVASPCSADWSRMSGDERARFCGQCKKHVYDLSALRNDEVRALVQKTEGKLCAKFYQRADGTVLTADCPVGVARHRRVLAAAAVLVFTLIAFPVLLAAASRQKATDGGIDWDRVEQFARQAPLIGPLINYLSPERMPVVMGAIAAPPPP